MTQHTVIVSAIKYVASDGSIRDGFQGEVVDVDDKFVARFDTLNTFDTGPAVNGGVGPATQDPADEPPARRTRKAAD
jgi:hypothetical protein